MSRINGEKARAAVAKKRRTAQREKTRTLREQHIASHGGGKKEGVAEKVKTTAKATIKKATDTLAELAESVKPKRAKKSEEAK